MSSVVVRFGADISEYAAGIQRAAAENAKFGNSLKGLNDNLGFTAIAEDAAKVSAELTVAAATVSIFSKNFDAFEAGQNVRSGNFGALGTQILNAAKATGEASAQALLARSIFVGLGLGAAGAVIGFIALANAVDEANRRILAVASAEAFAGNLDKIEKGATYAGEGTARFLHQLEKIQGVSADQAMALQATIGSIHNYSHSLEQLVIDILPAYAAASGQTVPDAMRQLSTTLDQPLEKIKQFVTTLPNATQAEIAHAEAVARSGNQNQAIAAIMAIMLDRYQQSGNQLAELTAKQRSWSEAVAEAGAAEGGFDIHTELTTEKLREQTDALAANLVARRAQIAAEATRPQTPEQRAEVAGRVVAGANPLTAQIEDSETKIQELKSHLMDLQTAPSLTAGMREDAQKTNEVIAQLEQKLVTLTNQQRGGTPSQLIDLSSANDTSAHGQDSLRDARAKAQAAADEVAQLKAALGPQAKSVELTQAETKAAQATLSVRMQELDLARAKNSLAGAGAQGSDAANNLAEAKANAAAVAKVYAAGSQQRIEAAVAVANAQKAVDAETEQDQADKENQAFSIAQNQSQARITLIKREEAEGAISHQQELAQLTAALAEQLAVEKAHYGALQGIWDDGTAQYRAATNQLAQVDSQAAAERLKVTQQVTVEITNEYKKAFERIGNSVSESIMGMIAGHETFRMQVRKILLMMIQDEIATNITKVADWLASETAKTAATIMGNSVRTGSDAAAGMASAAIAAQSVLQQVMIDAKAVFAGIFGFLAPVMGPAAAGPAAAGAATVLGGIYADGSWQIPSDQLAQLHQGEMVVPAAHTPWAQSLMANGGPAGGAVHNHFSPTVNYHQHGSTTAEDLRANADTLVKILQQQHRRGAFTGGAV